VEKGRVVEAIEVALKRGAGRLNVYVMPAGAESSDSELWRFSSGLHCPDSDLRYTDPIPSAFSFNSAVGACEACRGFGRVIGVDYGLVIPNDKLTLRAGAIKPMQTPAWKECQDDLMRHAETAGIPRDTPWNKLTPEQQLGHQRLAELERQVEPALVRRQALLRIPGDQVLQDAHPGAAVQVPQLHALRHLRRRAPEDREPALAHRLEGRCRRGDGAGQSASCPKGLPGPAPSWRPCRACACMT
jgi:hypothetical protein